MQESGWDKAIFIIKNLGKQFDKVLKGIDDIKDMFQSSEGADFAASDLRAGKKAFSGTALVTGTMNDNGNVAQKLDGTTTSYTIPAGFHEGSGTVSVDTQTKSASLSTTAQTIKPDAGKLLTQVSIPAVKGTATAGHVLAGDTFNSATAGIEKTGTMPNNSGTTQSAVASIANSLLRLLIPVAGYYDTTAYLTADVGTATQAQVLSGKTFTSTAGVKNSGTMPDKSGASVQASAVTSDETNTYLTIPTAGFYNTGSKVFTPNSNLGGDLICNVVYRQDYNSSNTANKSFTTVNNGIYLITVFRYQGYGDQDSGITINSGGTILSESGQDYLTPSSKTKPFSQTVIKATSSSVSITVKNWTLDSYTIVTRIK